MQLKILNFNIKITKTNKKRDEIVNVFGINHLIKGGLIEVEKMAEILLSGKALSVREFCRMIGDENNKLLQKRVKSRLEILERKGWVSRRWSGEKTKGRPFFLYQLTK